MAVCEICISSANGNKVFDVQTWFSRQSQSYPNALNFYETKNCFTSSQTAKVTKC